MRSASILAIFFLSFSLQAYSQSQPVPYVIMNQRVSDMVYDSVLSSIIISIPSTDTLHGNSIGCVDPDNAILTNSVFVGDEPHPLGLTDNGQFLYFGSDSTGTIRKLDLFNQSIVQSIQLHYKNGSGQAIAKEIACQPGNDSVIAMTGKYSLSTGYPAVCIFSNGVKLQDTVNSINYHIHAIQFKTPSILYGYDYQTSNETFTTNDVGPNGITVQNSIYNTIFSNYSGIKFTINGNMGLGDDGKTVYLNYNPPVPGGGCMLLPNMGYGTKRSCFDPYMGLLCIARWVNLFSSPDSIYIERFNRNNFLPYDVLRVPAFNGEVRKIINWGGPGKYAICTTDGRLIIVNATSTSGINQPEHNNISIFPNPTDGPINIIYQLPQNEPGKFEIFDLTGRCVYKTSLPSGTKLQTPDLSFLNSGIYQAVLTLGAETAMRKIVLTKE